MRPHHFVLRIPPAVWDEITSTAELEHRSVHAEILHRILS